MKKKIISIFIIILLTTGCTTIESNSYDEILTNTTNNLVNTTNINRVGYKYYLPKGMRLLSYEGSNEIISHDKNIYYLYVDYVSYYNKIPSSYTESQTAVYSKNILKDKKFGYIEIKNTENDKYFIEIMYNYAKIEVIVDKEATKETIAYAMSILSSITYQDTVLTSLMGEDVLKTNEVEHNIFAPADTESEYLEIVEEYGTYEDDSDKVDPDFIRR